MLTRSERPAEPVARRRPHRPRRDAQAASKERRADHQPAYPLPCRLFRVCHRSRHARRLLLCAIGRPPHVAPRPDDGVCLSLLFSMPSLVLTKLIALRHFPASFSWTSSRRSRTAALAVASHRTGCSSPQWRYRSSRSSGSYISRSCRRYSRLRRCRSMTCSCCLRSGARHFCCMKVAGGMSAR
jgi:hypothetical protein